jgi:hypothetical protein
MIDLHFAFQMVVKTSARVVEWPKDGVMTARFKVIAVRRAGKVIALITWQTVNETRQNRN